MLTPDLLVSILLALPLAGGLLGAVPSLLSVRL